MFLNIRDKNNTEIDLQPNSLNGLAVLGDIGNKGSKNVFLQF